MKRDQERALLSGIAKSKRCGSITISFGDKDGSEVPEVNFRTTYSYRNKVNCLDTPEIVILRFLVFQWLQMKNSSFQSALIIWYVN